MFKINKYDTEFQTNFFFRKKIHCKLHNELKKEMGPIITITEDSNLIIELKCLIESIANECLQNNSTFNMGLSGKFES